MTDNNKNYQVPDLDLRFLQKLVTKLYGIRSDDWKILNSYDDKNFLLSNCKIIDNSGKCISDGDYVLKITNCRDSSIENFIGKILSENKIRILKLIIFRIPNIFDASFSK